jgi:hypothetical protein
VAPTTKFKRTDNRVELTSMPQYVDRRGRERWTYICYVIQLDVAACATRGAPCGGVCERRPVYVGQTTKTASERFAIHKAGGRHASRWVRDFGLHLRPRLSASIGELDTRDAALEAERELGERLRRRGYCVYGAH